MKSQLEKLVDEVKEREKSKSSKQKFLLHPNNPIDSLAKRQWELRRQGLLPMPKGKSGKSWKLKQHDKETQ